LAGSDPVLDALDHLEEALARNTDTIHSIRAHISYIRESRAAGLSYREIVTDESRPLIVELTTANLQSLLETGNRLRRAEAQALHDEGVTMGRIADLFGVTRQRISERLRKAPVPAASG